MKEITIERFGIDHALYIGVDDGCYSFKLSEPVSELVLAQIKAAIENMLNQPET